MNRRTRGSALTSWRILPRRRIRLTTSTLWIACVLALMCVGIGSAATKKRKSSKKAVAHAQPAPPKPKVVGAAGLIAVAQRELEQGHFAPAANYAKDASGESALTR